MGSEGPRSQDFHPTTTNQPLPRYPLPWISTGTITPLLGAMSTLLSSGSTVGDLDFALLWQNKARTNQLRGFPGSPVVRTLRSQCRGVQVPSLVKKLRSPMPHNVARGEKKPTKTKSLNKILSHKTKMSMFSSQISLSLQEPGRSETE